MSNSGNLQVAAQVTDSHNCRSGWELCLWLESI